MSKLSGRLINLTAKGRQFRSRTYLGVLALLVGMVAMGCSQGSYPLDIFYEMHYQPSFKAHEPPRLSPPASAVPFYEVQVSTHDGGELYDINCSMCHGPLGRGDGPVLQKMEDTYGYVPTVPADLTAVNDPLMIAKDVAGVTNIMTGGLTVMPSFSKLLTQEQIDAVANYVVDCLQGVNPEGC
ncbi:MAG: cytochrome c [Chloroflexota bacterium]|nr:cytochrome c [Chloroflexota bacterium]